MTTYRQRKDQADRLRSERPCPTCGHELGAHRGIEWECIAEGCACTKGDPMGDRYIDDADPTWENTPD